MRIVDSIAMPLATGSEPGSARQTGQTCVLGGAPNAVGQPQNIFDRGAQLDVRLQAEHRLETLERLVIGTASCSQ